MAVTTTAWGARLDELLADGEWHELEEVLAAIMPLVPPGVAYRVGERRRLMKRSTAPAQRHHGDDAASVAAGRRTIAKDAVRARTRHGDVERDGDRIRRPA